MIFLRDICMLEELLPQLSLPVLPEVPLPVESLPEVSLPDVFPICLCIIGVCANFVHFRGSQPLLPHLCPLSVPKGGGMWGIFGKRLKRANWNTQVCMLY